MKPLVLALVLLSGCSAPPPTRPVAGSFRLPQAEIVVDAVVTFPAAPPPELAARLTAVGAVAETPTRFRLPSVDNAAKREAVTAVLQAGATLTREAP